MASAAEHVRAAARAGIGPKSALMEHAASARGLATTRWSATELVVEVPDSGAVLPFHQMNGPSSSIAGRFCCDEKAVAQDLLRGAGVSVATSRAFDPGDVREAMRWAEATGYPVVTKPTNSSRGSGVTANIRTPEAFGAAWHRARLAHRNPWISGGATFARSLLASSVGRRRPGWPARAAAYARAIGEAGATAWRSRWSPVLVEKHFDGCDYRIFVVGDRVVSVTQRKAANVVGDGRATVLELIDRKNEIRAENPYLCNYPIPRAPERLDVLTSAGLTLSHVPRANELVVLRSASNLAAGGDSVDLTDEAHPSFRDVAIRAVRAIPGIEYAGIDLITPDITVAPTPANYIVSEVEYSPAPLAHFPLVGGERDMAGAVVEYYLDRHIQRGRDRVSDRDASSL